jgi:hypothetical protein
MAPLSDWTAHHRRLIRLFDALAQREVERLKRKALSDS